MSSSGTLRQVHIDWLRKQGVSPEAMIHPDVIEVARGSRADDGIFEVSEDGPEWLAFPAENDSVFWRPASGQVATEFGQAFALGQEEIYNPGVTALDGWLQVHATPLDWLRNHRRGLVIIRWEWAWEQLKDVPRIAVPESLLGTYQRHMQPPMPKLGVITGEQGRAAA